MEKQLYKPFKSTRAGKKMSVYVMKNGKKRLIHFGATGYPDWKSGTATKQQRKSYLARAKGIKNKEGKLTWKDKNTANYWSIRLWSNTKPSWA